MGDYILGTEERRRLELLEQCLDPMTTRSLDAIGVEPGWRCLEVGGGGGSVTRMLCERAGPSGRVTAVDLDTRFLEEIEHENLDVCRQDIVADGLPGDAYDLVHARLLLMHLPTREKVLEQMAATLRPGGWLLIEEMDVYPLLATADGLYRRVWDAAIVAMETAGAAAMLGRELPRLFDCAGLEAVAVNCDVPTFRGGEIFTDLVLATLLQVRPLLQAHGITDAELEELARILQDPGQWFSSFAAYSVRGRAR
jgi:SAM-dependent methyltransferase